ncbi:hypothetical protein BH23THE1_BH23THE1_29930 [soil metagenome]
MSTFISIKDCIAANLQAPNPPKEIASKSGEKYTRTYLSYNYGTIERPYLAEPLFELKICKGRVKKNAKGVTKLNLTITDPDDIKGMDQLSSGFALCVEKHKGKFGLKKFDPESPGDLHGALLYPSNEEGKEIEGASPIASLKMNEKTKFKLLKPKIDPETKEPIYVDSVPDFEEEVIDYNTLLDKQIDCSVVVSARDMYRSSGMPVPQMFVRSCMVLSMSDNGEVEHTRSEMVRGFLLQNPEILNTLADQIAKMKAGGGEKPSLLQTAEGPKDNSNPPAQAMPLISSPAPIQVPIANVPSIPINDQLNLYNNNNQSIPQQSTIPQGGLDLSSFINGQQQQGGTVNVQRI